MMGQLGRFTNRFLIAIQPKNNRLRTRQLNSPVFPVNGVLLIKAFIRGSSMLILSFELPQPPSGIR